MHSVSVVQLHVGVTKSSIAHRLPESLMKSSPPGVQAIDHVHVFVSNRNASERWYEEVMGFVRSKELEFGAADGGPLTIQDVSGKVHIALFERPAEKCRSVVALGVDGAAFLAWKTHLSELLAEPPSMEDHGISWSLYFRDPDGNPYEITTYEYQAVKHPLASSDA